MRVVIICLFLSLLLFLMICTQRDSIIKLYTNIPAFPGAEGFGAFTPGGRGGEVYFVTNLKDYIPEEEPPIAGSLREAVEAEGPRIIVFRIGGLIQLKTQLSITNPFVTIAGQTAPGDGVCISNYRVNVETHDVIIRYLRCRLGDLARKEQDALNLTGATNVILDHCSTSWSTDEVLSITTDTTDGGNITIQWCMITEGLRRSFHPKGSHGHGSLMRSRKGGITLYHNVYAHNDNRNPRPASVADYPGPIFDFRNNLVYNWGRGCGYAGKYLQRTRINYVSNYFKPGPSTSERARTKVFNPNDRFTKLFVANNFLEGFPAANKDNWLMISGSEKLIDTVKTTTEFPVPPIPTYTAEEAYHRILNDVGATLPIRDSVDQRIIQNIINGTGHIIDSQEEVGSWPQYATAELPADADSDGMPDEWERKYNLNPQFQNDNRDDPDGDGYTNVEEYLNATDPLVAEKYALDYDQFVSVLKKIHALDRDLDEEIKIDKERREREEATRELPEIEPVLDPTPVASESSVILRIDGTSSLKLRLIPAGSFMMGSPENEELREEDETYHKVTISTPFYMSATTITVEQVRAVLGDIAPLSDQKNLPVRLPFLRARKFCEVLSSKTEYTFRLPTEAEWEYACRAGTTTPFNTGMTISTDLANYDGEYVYGTGKPGVFRGRLTPVGTFPPNAWGLYDMHGNFFEWCNDHYGEYPKGSVTDPKGPNSGKSRILRGGSYSSHPEFLRSANRYSYGIKDEFTFRVVMELPKM
ncbi:MAG: SUMF1/EgtB/PvdO family nonheme iron enzyme [bacterium]|nr:MAG: SUMF1/EgtB/PvdO family nonheme iron enzyme [bacterium]